MTSRARKGTAHGNGGFTLVEALAAMLFVAIVIPVIVHGLTVANRAGVMAERKRVAAQLADRLLTELVITEAWRDGEEEGDFGDDWPAYRWFTGTDAWQEDTMREVFVEVAFDVQGKEYNVRLSTLVEEAEE